MVCRRCGDEKGNKAPCLFTPCELKRGDRRGLCRECVRELRRHSRNQDPSKALGKTELRKVMMVTIPERRKA
jgi:hypothetical protein